MATDRQLEDAEAGRAQGGFPLPTTNRFAVLEVSDSAPHDTIAFQDVVDKFSSCLRSRSPSKSEFPVESCLCALRLAAGR